MGKIYAKFKKIAEENKDEVIVNYKNDGQWESYKYFDFLSRVDALAVGLLDLDIEKGDRAAIFSENRWEWLASDLAINKIGGISVPIHYTSNQDTIEYILKDSESDILIISRKLYYKHKEFIDSLNDLDEIILLDNEKNSNFLMFSDLIEKNKGREVENVNNLEISSIIYTSGTTGEPKGVMLTEDNFVSNVESVLKRIKVYQSDIFLSFLPLSHVLERTAGSYVPVFSGASISYVGDILKLSEYFGEVKPTIMISVPKIFEKSYEKIFAGIKEKGESFEKIFYKALRQKRGSLSWKIADFLIFKKLRKKVFGGRLRLAISGGANINEQILKFFKKIGVEIVQGYGLTETSPIVSANSLEDNKLGTVGTAIEGVEIKIAPDKEVKVRGLNIMKGYWKKEDKTKEVMDDDGWFLTGDLGFLDKDNFLTIIGRKKEIIVTSNGKNIAPEKIESVINLNLFIEQSLLVGHKRAYLAALIVPDKKTIKEKFGSDNEALFYDIVEKEMKKINKQLESHEQIKKFKIIDKAFTIEAGELTPTLKIRRKIIENEYESAINKLYSS